ncbi:LytTR family transcriptional regulator DNA-binding domain-containing protein [Clostridium sp. SHJSY1]|uniref:LytTR family DNA-binding domain-containing protein n=1 Tax=Clostridium sp. SHJSY1 TaxID=2942483 RepID=UPI00287532E6|nr:LytTR family DNA-binding domain-containing protein [Clostridium sp. SHJSY1]MDS0527056.1 LytTR family transcriptional regulator DNA-binding domain-containing protein [Clostridium sp. SHJSY1]
MKVLVIEDSQIQDIEIKIVCPQRTKYVEHLVSTLTEEQVTIKGKMDNEYTKIFLQDIYYFEVVDNKTFIYCNKSVYQSDMKLYELEKYLANTSFSRINKSCILNISKLKKVKSQINGRLLATLSNEENLIINRSYVAEIKRILKI